MADVKGARLQEFLDGIGELLGRRGRRASFAGYAVGLLGEGDRKSMEPIAMRACDGVAHADASHQRVQNLITADWCDPPVRRYAASYALSEMLSAGRIRGRACVS